MKESYNHIENKNDRVMWMGIILKIKARVWLKLKLKVFIIKKSVAALNYLNSNKAF